MKRPNGHDIPIPASVYELPWIKTSRNGPNHLNKTGDPQKSARTTPDPSVFNRVPKKRKSRY